MTIQEQIEVRDRYLSLVTLDTPFISVIIPNYNHANYLDERIQSVLNQTYQNFEIIILDDKSTDNSADVIEKYRIHPKVSKIIINQHNSGSTFKQWHKGFELAKGDYVWIAESDDSCDKTLLERNVKNFINDEHCVLSFACSLRMDENGVLHNKMQSIQKDISLDGLSFNRQYMYCGCVVANASSALFRKNAALEADKVYMNYKGGGDRVFWMEIAERGRVSIISAPLNYFRKHNLNTTKKLYEDGTDYFEAKKTYDFIKKRYNIGHKESLRIYNYYIYLIKHVEHFKNDKIKESLLKCWNPSLLVTLLVDILWFKKRLKNKLSSI